MNKMKIKIEPDLRTPEEWAEWAALKIENKPCNLTESIEIINGKIEVTGEIGEMKLGDCIEFNPENSLEQRIVKN